MFLVYYFKKSHVLFSPKKIILVLPGAKRANCLLNKKVTITPVSWQICHFSFGGVCLIITVPFFVEHPSQHHQATLSQFLSDSGMIHYSGFNYKATTTIRHNDNSIQQRSLTSHGLRTSYTMATNNSLIHEAFQWFTILNVNETLECALFGNANHACRLHRQCYCGLGELPR